MARGKKTGGRIAGTPNKIRRSLTELLAEKYPAYHPVLALADIANNKKNQVNIRFQAHKEVAKYICPQLKLIEYKEPPSAEEMDLSDWTREELEYVVRTRETSPLIIDCDAPIQVDIERSVAE